MSNRKTIKVAEDDASKLKELSPELVMGEQDAPYWVIVKHLLAHYKECDC